METIIIHPTSKQQTKAFEEMAIALNIPFEIEYENEKENNFIADFKNGLSVEDARKASLTNVKKLWQK